MLPGSMPGCGKYFYVYIFVVVVCVFFTFLCPKPLLILSFTMLIRLVYLTYCTFFDRLYEYEDKT